MNNKYHFLNISLRLMHRLNVDIEVEVEVEVGRVVRRLDGDMTGGAVQQLIAEIAASPDYLL